MSDKKTSPKANKIFVPKKSIVTKKPIPKARNSSPARGIVEAPKKQVPGESRDRRPEPKAEKALPDGELNDVDAILNIKISDKKTSNFSSIALPKSISKKYRKSRSSLDSRSMTSRKSQESGVSGKSGLSRKSGVSDKSGRKSVISKSTRISEGSGVTRDTDRSSDDVDYIDTGGKTLDEFNLTAPKFKGDVELHVIFSKVSVISTKNECFTGEIIISTCWSETLLQTEEATELDSSFLKRCWNPGVMIDNALIDLKHISQKHLIDKERPTYLTQIDTFWGTFQQHVEMIEFPFDIMSLSLLIRLENCTYDNVKIIDNPREMHYVWLNSFNFTQEYHLHQVVEASILPKSQQLLYGTRNPVRQVKCFASRKAYFLVAKSMSILFVMCLFALVPIRMADNNRFQSLFQSVLLIVSLFTYRSVTGNHMPRAAGTNLTEMYLNCVIIYLTSGTIWIMVLAIIRSQLVRSAIAHVGFWIFVGFDALIHVGLVVTILIWPYRKRRAMLKREKEYKFMLIDFYVMSQQKSQKMEKSRKSRDSQQSSGTHASEITEFDQAQTLTKEEDQRFNYLVGENLRRRYCLFGGDYIEPELFIFDDDEKKGQGLEAAREMFLKKKDGKATKIELDADVRIVGTTKGQSNKSGKTASPTANTTDAVGPEYEVANDDFADEKTSNASEHSADHVKYFE